MEIPSPLEATELDFEQRREARTRSTAAVAVDPDQERRARERAVHRAEKAGQLIAYPEAYVDQTWPFAPF